MIMIIKRVMMDLIKIEMIESYICSSCCRDEAMIKIMDRYMILDHLDDHIICYSYSIADDLCCYCNYED